MHARQIFNFATGPDTQITEQVSNKISSTNKANRNQQVKDKFDNFNAQIVAIKASFMNKINELKNEVDRLKQKLKIRIMICQIN